jgi:hypothetical protein
MAVELDELKSQHERMAAHHAAYKKQKLVADIFAYASLAALIVYWLLNPGLASSGGTCSGAFCAVSSWLVAALVVLAAVLLGLVFKHQARGVSAYRKAMTILGSRSR